MSDTITVIPSDIVPTQPVATNPALVYLASLPSARSRYVQRLSLNAIARLLDMTVETMPWHELRYQHTQALRARMIDSGLAPASVNRMLAALRGVLKQAWRLGLMGADDYQRAIDLQPVRGSRPPRGRSLEDAEIAALLKACDNTPTGVLDAVLVALGVTCGLRRAEMAALDLRDYDAANGVLTVRGKGRKTRLVYITNGARVAMDDWLALRGDADGALLCHVYRNGRIGVGERITGGAIYNRLTRLARKAGVADVSPHDLRRTCASNLLDAGTDISTVAGVLGHANVATTQRYDRRGERAKQRAAALLDIPYKRGANNDE